MQIFGGHSAPKQQSKSYFAAKFAVSAKVKMLSVFSNEWQEYLCNKYIYCIIGIHQCGKYLRWNRTKKKMNETKIEKRF